MNEQVSEERLVEIEPAAVEVLPFSVVNDVGVIFEWQSRIFRGIYSQHVETVKSLMRSGLIEELVEIKAFPVTRITDYKMNGFGLIIEHERIRNLSYPYEWTFSMLKDAALLVLRVNALARQHQYQLRDCHTLNVVFDNTTPKYVDLGSFTKEKNDVENWAAYEEFIRSYYYPLKIWSSGDAFIARRLLDVESDFIPHESYLLYRYKFIRLLSGRMLGRLRRSINNYFRFRKLQATPAELILCKTQNRGKIKEIIGKTLYYLRRKNQLPFQKIDLDNLANKIKKLSHKNSGSRWGSYHNELYSHSGEIVPTARLSRIIEIIKGTDITTVTELGGNQGVASRLLLKNTEVERAICIDYDDDAVESMYSILKSIDISLTPVVQNCIFPMVGSCGKPPWKRFQSDLVIALALSHHLILAQNLRIEFILKRICDYTKKYVMIEFMPLGLWDGTGDIPIPQWYTVDWFRKSLKEYTDILLEEELEENRIVFLGELRHSGTK